MFLSKKTAAEGWGFLIYWKTVVIANVFVLNEKLYRYIFHCCAPLVTISVHFSGSRPFSKICWPIF